MFAYCLEDDIGADDVGFDKWPWVAQGIVVVTFGGEVHDDVGVGDKFVHELAVANIAAHKVDFIEDAREVIRVAGVGELVDDGDFKLGFVVECIVNKV